jgi:hypothetical protein
LSPLKKVWLSFLPSSPLICFPLISPQERLDSNLQQLVEDTYEAVTQQLTPDLQRAYAAEDEQALEGICDQVAALVEVLDAAFNKLALKQQTQLWVQVRWALRCIPLSTFVL